MSLMKISFNICEIIQFEPTDNKIMSDNISFHIKIKNLFNTTKGKADLFEKFITKDLAVTEIVPCFIQSMCE